VGGWMRKTIIVGNWKMHNNVHQSSVLVHRLEERIPIHKNVEIVLAPNFLALQPLSSQIDRRKFRLAAQNAYFEDEGTYTGEVSFMMLRDLVHYVLVGHSERRHKFGETDKEISQKVASALRNELSPILCVGETQTERVDGETKQVLHDQVKAGLHFVSREDLENIVIAYEPVWAISDGKDFKDHKAATPTDVAEAVETIRHNVREIHGKPAESKMRVIYGGSSNAENARAFLDVDGVDGLLPGGASLNYQQFSGIVEAAFHYSKG